MISIFKRKGDNSDAISLEYYSIDSKSNYFDATSKIFHIIENSRESESLFLFELNQNETIAKVNLIKQEKGDQIILKPKEYSSFIKKIRQSKYPKFVLAHNHPSQDCNPSIGDLVGDIILCKEIKQFGKQLLDNIIWTEQQIYSIRLAKTIESNIISPVL